MEFCEKHTLRQAIDNGLYRENYRSWRLFRYNFFLYLLGACLGGTIVVCKTNVIEVPGLNPGSEYTTAVVVVSGLNPGSDQIFL